MNISYLTNQIANFLTNIIQTFGLPAIFLLMTAESALIPIPSEITMPFAGFLAGRGVFNFWGVIAIGALGNLVGSLAAYWLGFAKGEDWTRIAIKKWGKWLLINEKEFETAKKWFQKYGQTIAFTSRLLPIVRTFISLPAGISKMNVFYFSFLTFVGSLLWSTFLAWLGLKLGQNWMALEPYFRKFQFLIVVFFILGIVAYIKIHLKKRSAD